MQGNCTAPPPAALLPRGAARAHSDAQCVLACAYGAGALLAVDRAFRNVSLLLDRLALTWAAPDVARPDVTLLDLPNPEITGSTGRYRVWLRRMALLGPGRTAQVGAVRGLRLTEQWQVAVQGMRALNLCQHYITG